MSERERRALARIERHFVETDPRLARMLASHRVPSRSTPVLLLAIGLASILLGSVTVMVPLVLGGALISLSALAVAAVRGIRTASTA